MDDGLVDRCGRGDHTLESEIVIRSARRIRSHPKRLAATKEQGDKRNHQHATHIIPLQHPSPPKVQLPPPHIHHLPPSLLHQQPPTRMIPDLLLVHAPTTVLRRHPQVRIPIAPCEGPILRLAIHADPLAVVGLEGRGDGGVDGVGRVRGLDGLEEVVRRCLRVWEVDLGEVGGGGGGGDREGELVGTGAGGC